MTTMQRRAWPRLRGYFYQGVEIRGYIDEATAWLAVRDVAPALGLTAARAAELAVAMGPPLTVRRPVPWGEKPALFAAADAFYGLVEGMLEERPELRPFGDWLIALVDDSAAGCPDEATLIELAARERGLAGADLVYFLAASARLGGRLLRAMAERNATVCGFVDARLTAFAAAFGLDEYDPARPGDATRVIRCSRLARPAS